jgi:hypothetical protein
VLAVADGHGDKAHARSDRGSRFAVDIALDLLKGWLDSAERGPATAHSGAVTEVGKGLIHKWRSAVDADLVAHPPGGPDEPDLDLTTEAGREAGRVLYGSTLIVAALGKRFAMYLQIGDGDLLVVGNDGSVRYVLPGRTDVALNRTDSLCQTDALERLRSKVEVFDDGGPPALVLLSSDGYANSFSDENAFLKVARDFQNYISQQGLEWVAKRAESWLTETTRAGSGDDITLALASPGPHSAMPERGRTARWPRVRTVLIACLAIVTAIDVFLAIEDPGAVSAFFSRITTGYTAPGTSPGPTNH